MSSAPPIVLTVAGFDPSSGAGITADIKTIAAHGCYGIACITALTVQSTKGVRRVYAIEGSLVRETLDDLAADFPIAAVHIGMLGNEQVAAVVADFLRDRRPTNVVLDPILRSSSGAELLNPAGLRILVEELLPLVTVVTPNIDEAAVLTGMKVAEPAQMAAAAVRLHTLGAAAVVVTGGHLDKAIDLLSIAGKEAPKQVPFEGERQASSSTHGTGCAFSTALACELVLGKGLLEAVPAAKDYVAKAIAGAYPLGHGVGSVNHFYGFRREE